MNGCTGPSEQPLIFPPLDVDWPDGERAHCNVCPVRLCTSDVLDLMRSHDIAEGRLSLAECDSLPEPYIAAWQVVSRHLAPAREYKWKLRHGR